jgi:hypothetical protein
MDIILLALDAHSALSAATGNPQAELSGGSSLAPASSVLRAESERGGVNGTLLLNWKRERNERN